MQFARKHSRILKIAGLTICTTSAGWLYYQVKKTQDILNNALDSSILSIMEKPNEKQIDTSDFFIVDIPKEIENTNSIIDSLKLAFARRLLNFAHSHNNFIKNKSINQLARIKFSDCWHFTLLANMIDAETAVRLARTKNIDLRFFIEPVLHHVNNTQEKIIDTMKDLLIVLNSKSEHPCMNYFIVRTFGDVHQDEGRIVDHDIPSVQVKKINRNSKDLLLFCLESLIHHASIEKYARDIVELNGLVFLMEIYKKYKNDNAIIVKLCKIISYISQYPDLLDDLFKSGWIRVLAEWMKENDIHISLPAAKALANLDYEDIVYSHRLYLLYPIDHNIKKIHADVVFVHGLLGGAFFTWRQRDTEREILGLLGKNDKRESLTQDSGPTNCPKEIKPVTSDPDTRQYFEDMEEQLEFDHDCDDFEIVWNDIPTNSNMSAEGPYSECRHKFSCKPIDEYYTYCWPRDWLAQDCENLRIIGINYDTKLSMWAPMCPTENIKKTLDERSDELIYHLIEAQVGSRPIIWVTHSMGGLIVKNLLHKALKSDKPEIRNICMNTKGTIFYSTPHRGSSVANLNQASSLFLWPSVEVQELQENSQQLIDIHHNFLNILKRVQMKIVTFVETKPTIVTAMKFKFLFVQPKSGNPGVGEYYEIPLNHLDICKPANRHSFIYQKVLHIINEILSSNESD